MKRSYLIGTLILTIFIVTVIPTSVMGDGSFLIPAEWLDPEVKIEAAQTNGALARLDALLAAYESSGDLKVEDQIYRAADDLEDELNDLYSAVKELDAEEFDIIEDSYQNLIGSLGDLALRAESAEIPVLQQKIIEFIDAISFEEI